MKQLVFIIGLICLPTISSAALIEISYTGTVNNIFIIGNASSQYSVGDQVSGTLLVDTDYGSSISQSPNSQSYAHNGSHQFVTGGQIIPSATDESNDNIRIDDNYINNGVAGDGFGVADSFFERLGDDSLGNPLKAFEATILSVIAASILDLTDGLSLEQNFSLTAADLANQGYDPASYMRGSYTRSVYSHANGLDNHGTLIETVDTRFSLDQVQYTTIVPSIPVPEPGTLLLLSIALLVTRRQSH